MEINGMNFTIGADPELFIGKGDKPRSAFGLIEGDKINPQKVNYGAVQVDGMALEFNIDPANNQEEFKHNINEVMKTMLGMIKGYNIINTCSVKFHPNHFNHQPYEAMMLGCDPDYNGYSLKVNPTPKPIGKNRTLRTAGGHVHIGWDKINKNPSVHFNQAAQLARYMDQEVGVYSILWDGDSERRQLYGKAGAFRSKPYGMEYRSMSNKWIFNEKLIEVVFDFTIDAINKMFENKDSDNTVESIINKSDVSSSFFKNNKKAERILDILHST